MYQIIDRSSQGSPRSSPIHDAPAEKGRRKARDDVPNGPDRKDTQPLKQKWSGRDGIFSCRLPEPLVPEMYQGFCKVRRVYKGGTICLEYTR